MQGNCRAGLRVKKGLPFGNITSAPPRRGGSFRECGADADRGPEDLAGAGQKIVDTAATGEPRVGFDLEVSTHLVNWAVVRSRTAAAGTGALGLDLAQSPSLMRRYYRIRRG